MCNKILILSLLALVPLYANAQSPFSTAEADGAILLRDGGLAQFHLKEKLFRVGYQWDLADRLTAEIRDDSSRFNERPRFLPRFGLELQAKPSDNVAILLRDENFASGAGLSLNVGVGYLFSFQPSAQDAQNIAQGQHINFGWVRHDRLSFQGNISHSGITLIDTDAAFEDQTDKVKSTEYSVRVLYNAETSGVAVLNMPIVFGVGLGFQKVNNTNELNSIKFKDVQTFTDFEGTERTITTDRSGLSGEFKETERFAIELDAMFYPFLDVSTGAASIAFNLFLRNTIGFGDRFVPGMGAYVTAPRAPLKVYGGINVYRGQDEDLEVGIVAGFGF